MKSKKSYIAVAALVLLAGLMIPVNYKAVCDRWSKKKDYIYYFTKAVSEPYSNEKYYKTDDSFTKEIPDFTKKNSGISLYARSACLIDALNNRVLFGKNAFERVAMASTTKIMTCIIALEYGKPDELVTVSKKAAGQPDVQLNIKEGEQYYLKDLLYALMLESHNDVAVAVAEHIGGSVEKFCEMMTKKAEELSLKNTSFKTPNGLDADGHYTTAAELAMLGAYAVENQSFLNITQAASYTFSEANGKRKFLVSNKNKFLYMMKGAIGIKTGFTNKAGYCFVGAVEEEGKRLVAAVLASGWPPNKNYKWKDTVELMKYGLSNYSKQTFDFTEELKPVIVYGGKLTKVPLYIAEDTKLELLLHQEESLKIKYLAAEALTAPIEKDTKVGELIYEIAEIKYRKYDILIQQDVEKIDFGFTFEKIFKFF